MSYHLTIHDPEKNPQLVISKVPLWFDLLPSYPWHWPIWKWYSEIMGWWWNKLDTYPCVKFNITQEHRKQITETLWKQRFAAPATSGEEEGKQR